MTRLMSFWLCHIITEWQWPQHMKSELYIREQPFPRVNSSAGNIVESPSLKGLWLTLPTHGPVPSSRLTSGCPFQLISVIFFLSCQSHSALPSFFLILHGILASWLAKTTTLLTVYIFETWESPGLGSLTTIQLIFLLSRFLAFLLSRLSRFLTHHTKTSTCLISGISSLSCTRLVSDIF